MSLPDRNNPYNFDEYLEVRDSFDFFADDRFLQQVIKTYAPELDDAALADLSRMGKTLSLEWKQLADISGRPENEPHMMHHDAFNNRIDRIVRPASTLQLEKAVLEEAVFSESVSPWVSFIKIFLLCQLGEAGINCAHCCTGGLIRILEKYSDAPETNEIIEHMKEGVNGEFALASQFLSEIQGGSDVQANCVEAVKTADGWRIYGNKYYCSAAHADYALITAKPSDSSSVAVFVVPSWLPGDKSREKRNSYTINKLKSKLGTRELPTAEITYNGSLAFQVGELERGLANIVGIVLAHSRFICGISSGAQITRAARESLAYSEFRTAFGVTIKDFGLVALQNAKLDLYAKRCTAGAFKLQSEILKLDDVDKGLVKIADKNEEQQKRFHVRMLIMMQKLVACTDSALITETAMSILGANGLMEDFSALPRLYRDAVVIGGAWEGPRNLLLTRIYMDIQKSAAWYRPADFLKNLLAESDTETVERYGAELEAIIGHGTLMSNDPQTLKVCERWDSLCSDIIHEFQDNAVAEVLNNRG